MSDSASGDPTRTFVPLTKGTIVSHYRIVERIGAGGMGEVYLADDTRLHRQAALKFLPAHVAQDPEVRARFTREGQAVAKLDHPSIVTIYEVGEFKEQPFLAMQYVDGKTLSHYCSTESLSVEQITHLAFLICDGLAQAHSAGVSHRDVKPANIIVDRELRPKILDFGLASVQGTSPLTQTGSTLGTVAYMSPEQAQGLKIDHRSDLFSLGVVVYELITGRTPFKRDTEAATLHAIVHDPSEPLARFRANVPDEVQRIVSKLLERDPQMRFQTASDVMADLRKLATSGSVSIGRSQTIHSRRVALYAAISIVAALALVAVWLQKGIRNADSDSPVSMSMTPVTSDGKASAAAISPDGRYLAFVREDVGLQSLWIQHLGTGSRVQIVEPASLPITGLSFSPDGGYVYYRVLRSGQMGALMRIPVLGGSSQQILTNVWSKAAFSPDGHRIAFHRFMDSSGIQSEVIANADGTDERALVTTAPGAANYYFANPAWSPDGKTIAISKNVFEPKGGTLLAVLDTTTGQEVSLLSGNWTQELSIGWLPAGGLIVASDCHSNPFGRQLWKVNYPGGALRRITNDLSDYTDVSLTADGKRLAVIQKDTRAGVWLVPMAETQKAKQVLSGKYDGLGGVCWVDSQSVVFFTRTANEFGLSRLFIERERLELVVKGSPLVVEPSVSRNGKTLIYKAFGGEYSGVSICAPDGRNRRNLTPNGECWGPDISSDAKWVVYLDEAKGYPRVIRKSLEQDETIVLGDTTKASFGPRISPDGQWVACYLYEASEEQFNIAVMPSRGGLPTHLLSIHSSSDEGFTKLVWTADGSSILYQERKAGVSNIWSQPMAGGPARQITNFQEMRIRDFDLSPDGTQLVICRSESSSDVVLIEGF